MSPRGDDIPSTKPTIWETGVGSIPTKPLGCELPWKRIYSKNCPGRELQVGTGVRHSDIFHGHGAITLVLRVDIKGAWGQCECLAPICHPTACPWSHAALENYFGSAEVEKITTRRNHKSPGKANMLTIC
jgi:hypothetical protein